MNPHDEPRWSDAELDTLLTEFFRREMPAELRNFRGNARPRVTVESRSPSRAARQPAGIAGILVAAACLGMTVHLLTALGVQSARDGGPIEFVRKADDAARAREPLDVERPLPAHSAAEAVVIENVEERLETLDRSTFHTAEGPVEQRTDLRRTNVSAFDDRTGTSVEVEFLEELSIEIIPIPDE